MIRLFDPRGVLDPMLALAILLGWVAAAAGLGVWMYRGPGGADPADDRREPYFDQQNPAKTR